MTDTMTADQLNAAEAAIHAADPAPAAPAPTTKPATLEDLVAKVEAVASFVEQHRSVIEAVAGVVAKGASGGSEVALLGGVAKALLALAL